MYINMYNTMCAKQMKPSQGRKRPGGAATENSRGKGAALAKELFKLH